MTTREIDPRIFKVRLVSTSRKGPMKGMSFALTWNAWAECIRLSASFGKYETWEILSHGGRVSRRDARDIAGAMGRASSIVDVDPWFDELRNFVSEGGFVARVTH